MLTEAQLGKLYNLKRDRGSGWSYRHAKRITEKLITGELRRLAPLATETKLVWLVAPCLNDRLEGHKELLKLEGRSVLVPREKRFWPADAGLQWRMDRLRRS
jgi:hypothetical protein